MLLTHTRSNSSLVACPHGHKVPADCRVPAQPAGAGPEDGGGDLLLLLLAAGGLLHLRGAARRALDVLLWEIVCTFLAPFCFSLSDSLTVISSVVRNARNHRHLAE